MRASIACLLRTAAAGAMVVAGSGIASATDAQFGQAEAGAIARIALIDSNLRGCSQPPQVRRLDGVGPLCSIEIFDRASYFTTTQDHDRGTVEVYGTYLRSTTSAFTPDRLLTAPQRRNYQSTDFLLTGLKGSAFDDRLKFKAEFARTRRVVEQLLADDWAIDARNAESGTSSTLRLDAVLADRPGLKWSLTGEYRSVSDDYSVGRSPALFRYHGMPGTRLALSSAVRLRDVRLSAGLEQNSTPFGVSALRRAGIDLDGLSLRLVSRGTRVRPLEGSSLLAGRNRSQSIYADLDFNLLAASLLPSLDDLPFLVPDTVSLSYRAGETVNNYAESEDRFRLSSFGIDGMWETPIGETSLSYWRDRRDAVTSGARSRWSETMQIDHSVRWGRWRFGADATFTRGSGDGSSAYFERSWAFGQSIAYSTPNGPEFRLQLGQDRDAMRMLDDSYISADRYSRITASLDLSRYLQARFERSDLKLTIDYRKIVDRTDGEFMLGEEIIDRWVDADRRDGLLISFAMKL